MIYQLNLQVEVADLQQFLMILIISWDVSYFKGLFANVGPNLGDHSAVPNVARGASPGPASQEPGIGILE